MVFEKYRARKACAKELRSISIAELELEHQKLRNPYPPSYEDLYRDLEGDQPASSRSSVSSGSGSNQSSRAASPFHYVPPAQQQQRRQGSSSISSSSTTYTSRSYITAAAPTDTTERPSVHSRSGSDAST